MSELNLRKLKQNAFGKKKSNVSARISPVQAAS